jgi:pimeloyl-ACP methyl ester carboxylesterase
VTLLEDIGPAAILAHSAGAGVAVDVATSHPDLVNELILIEPAGPPAQGDFPALAGKSMLGVYGDYIDSRRQGGRMQATLEGAALFEANGGRGDVISMPEGYGVLGNTHLMMQDNNNEQIATLILNWLNGNELKVMEHAEGGGDTVPGGARRGRGGSDESNSGGRRRGGNRGGAGSASNQSAPPVSPG